MNVKDKERIEQMQQQQQHKSTERANTKAQQNQQQPPRKSIADATGLNETERKLVDLTSDLKSERMVRLTEQETMRKYGQKMGESCERLGNIIEVLEAELESVKNEEYTPEMTGFLLTGQPMPMLGSSHH